MRKMIAIDLRVITWTGIGTYLKNVVPLVIETYPESKFNLIGNADDLGKYEWTNKTNTIITECDSKIYSIEEQVQIPRKIYPNTSLYWSPHYNIPIFFREKILVTVHDLFHLAMPKIVGGVHKRLYAKLMFNAVKIKASAVITDSKFTKNEYVRLTDANRQNIHPIYLGVDQSWFDIPKEPKLHENSYIIYVGNVKPHKNLLGLIKAYSLLVENIPHDLLIVGPRDGFITGDNHIVKYAEKLKNRVHFTGYVEERMLKNYIYNADCLVLPSFYEGFGLPPLEAMALGCPVLVSNIGALKEICGDAAIYCNPYCHKDISENIEKILCDKKMKKELKKKGDARVRKFSWEKCAKETCRVIDTLIGSCSSF